MPFGLAVIAVLATVVFSYDREMRRAQRDVLIVQALESARVEIDRAFQVLQTLREEVERVSKQSTTDIVAVKGQAVQLEGGLRKVNGITRALQLRVQGLEEEQRASDGDQK